MQFAAAFDVGIEFVDLAEVGHRFAGPAGLADLVETAEVALAVEEIAAAVGADSPEHRKWDQQRAWCSETSSHRPAVVHGLPAAMPGCSQGEVEYKHRA